MVITPDFLDLIDYDAKVHLLGNIETFLNSVFQLFKQCKLINITYKNKTKNIHNPFYCGNFINSVVFITIETTNHNKYNLFQIKNINKISESVKLYLESIGYTTEDIISLGIVIVDMPETTLSKKVPDNITDSVYCYEKIINHSVIVYKFKGLIHRDDRDKNGYVLPAEIRANGVKLWYKNGKKHRDDRDKNGYVLPAEIYPDGTKYWYKNDKLHRDDKDANGHVLPAEIRANDSKSWYKNDKIHRKDRDDHGYVLPAIIHVNSRKEWYKNGKRHRYDKDANGYVLPTVIWEEGKKIWWVNGEIHREDRDENGYVLPAAIWIGIGKFWWKNGKIHRDDKDANGYVLPAEIYANGIKLWWINGEKHREDRDKNTKKFKLDSKSNNKTLVENHSNDSEQFNIKLNIIKKIPDNIRNLIKNYDYDNFKTFKVRTFKMSKTDISMVFHNVSKYYNENTLYTKIDKVLYLENNNEIQKSITHSKYYKMKSQVNELPDNIIKYYNYEIFK